MQTFKKLIKENILDFLHTACKCERSLNPLIFEANTTNLMVLLCNMRVVLGPTACHELLVKFEAICQ